MSTLVLLIRLAIVTALAFGAKHFGATPIGVFLGLLTVFYVLATLRVFLWPDRYRNT